MAQERYLECFDLSTDDAEHLIGAARDDHCLPNMEILEHRDSVWKEKCLGGCAGRLQHGVEVGITGIWYNSLFRRNKYLCLQISAAPFSSAKPLGFADNLSPA